MPVDKVEREGRVDRPLAADWGPESSKCSCAQLLLRRSADAMSVRSSGSCVEEVELPSLFNLARLGGLAGSDLSALG